MSSNPARRMARRASRYHPEEPMIPNGHRIALPNEPPQGPVFNVGPLMNDAQLIAWLACHLDGSPEECVAEATDLIAHAVAAVHGGTLEKKVKAAVAAAREKANKDLAADAEG